MNPKKKKFQKKKEKTFTATLQKRKIINTWAELRRRQQHCDLGCDGDEKWLSYEVRSAATVRRREGERMSCDGATARGREDELRRCDGARERLRLESVRIWERQRRVILRFQKSDWEMRNEGFRRGILREAKRRRIGGLKKKCWSCSERRRLGGKKKKKKLDDVI